MNIVAVILQILLGLAFLAAGSTKLMGQQQMIDDFTRYGYPQWFRLFTGVCEIAGGLGMLAGIGLAWLAALAGIWLAGVMLGALITHIRIHDPTRAMIPAGVLFVLAALVVALRWSSLSSHL